MSYISDQLEHANRNARDGERMKSDLVRRQDVLDIVYLDPSISETNAKMILDLPSAKPKQGEWIAYKGMQIPEVHGLHYCSNCNHSLHLASNGRVYNYCPRCGAKMEVIE